MDPQEIQLENIQQQQNSLREQLKTVRDERKRNTYLSCLTRCRIELQKLKRKNNQLKFCSCNITDYPSGKIQPCSSRRIDYHPGKTADQIIRTGTLNNRLNQKEKLLDQVKLKYETAVGKIKDMERDLMIEKQALKKKEKELKLAKQYIGRAMDIVSDLIQNEAEVNETEVRNVSETEVHNDTEGLLEWVLFGFKFAAELTLGIIEFWANKKHMKFLIAAILHLL